MDNAVSGAQNQQHSPDPILSRRTDPFLLTRQGFRVITALAAVCCITFNVLSAVRSFRIIDIFNGIFRCYAVAVGVIVVIAETEWEFFLNFSKVLQFWAGRGILQIFVAVMTRAYPEYLRFHQELFLLQSVAAYLLLGCGVIYVISGILCIGVLTRSYQRKEMSRDQAIKNLEDLQHRTEDLEASLLGDQA